MIDRDEEKIGRILAHLLSRQTGRGRVGCPNEEELVNYSSGLLTEEAKERLEVHLADCVFCLDDLVAAHKSAQDQEAERVPQCLIDRALAHLRPDQGEGSFLDIAVRLVKDSVELVSTTGRLLPITAPVGIRGRAKPLDSTLLQVEKELGRLKVGVEVEAVEAGLCEVIVRVKDAAGRAAEGIRLTLFSRGREQASYLARQGEAVFDRVPRGEYNLAISDSGASVGRIRLRIME